MKIKNLICIPIIVAAAAIPTTMYANDYFNNISNNINNESFVIPTDENSQQVLLSVDRINNENECDTETAEKIYNEKYNNSIYKNFYDTYIKEGIYYSKEVVPVLELNNEELINQKTYNLPWNNSAFYSIPLFYTSDGYGILSISTEINNSLSTIHLSSNTIAPELKGIFYSFINIPSEYKEVLSEDEVLWAGQAAIQILLNNLSFDDIKNETIVEGEELKAENIISLIDYLLNSEYEEKYVNIDIPQSFNAEYDDNENLIGIYSDKGNIDTNYNNYMISIINKSNYSANSLSILNADYDDGYYANEKNIKSFVIGYKSNDIKYYQNSCIQAQNDIVPGVNKYLFTNPNNYDEQIIFSGEDIPNTYYNDDNNNLYYIAKPVSNIKYYDIDLTPENYCSLYKTATINMNITDFFSKNNILNGTVELMDNDEYEKYINGEDVFNAQISEIKDGSAQFTGVKNGTYNIIFKIDGNYIRDNVQSVTINLDYTNSNPIQEMTVDYSVIPLFVNLNITDEDNLPYSNLVFDLYKLENDNDYYLGEFNTNENGTLLIYNLSEGTYRIHVKSNDNLNDNILHFYIDKNMEKSELNNCHLTLTKNGSIYEYVEYND